MHRIQRDTGILMLAGMPAKPTYSIPIGCRYAAVPVLFTCVESSELMAISHQAFVEPE